MNGVQLKKSDVQTIAIPTTNRFLDVICGLQLRRGYKGSNVYCSKLIKHHHVQLQINKFAEVSTTFINFQSCHLSMINTELLYSQSDDLNHRTLIALIRFLQKN